MFQKHPKCIFCILTPNHLTERNFLCLTVLDSINKADIGPLSFFCYKVFWSSSFLVLPNVFGPPGTLAALGDLKDRGTGSVWGGTGCFLVVLGQNGAELVDGWLIKKIDDSTGSVEGGTG